MSKWLLIAVVVWFGVCACASGPEKKPQVSYKANAEENFKKGQKAYEDEDYLEAIEFFQFVKNKFPYSTFAITGEVDFYLAECDFKRDKFIEAADAYNNFIKLHPKHPKVPYAMFRIGQCHMEQMPDDWFFTPPAYEMDQEETVRAVIAFERYLQMYPQDENIEQGRKLLNQCKEQLAKRAYYLMNFYRKRDHYRGVIWRADELINNYPGLGFDEEALYHKAEALMEMQNFPEARATLEKMLTQFPTGSFSGDAKKILAKLRTDKK